MYAESVKRRTGIFVNHDDNLGRSTLDGGMEETKALFFVRFGEVYDRCFCWDCEAVVSTADEAEWDVSLEDGDAHVRLLAERVAKDVEYYHCVELIRRDSQGLPI